MQGRIIALQGKEFIVKSGDSTFVSSAKGNLRIKNVAPIVGDYVELENNVITSIKERSSLLVRPKVSNVDQVVIVSSYVEPEFSYDLVFKYLTYANMAALPSILVISKLDKSENKSRIEEICNVFNKLNIKTIIVNSKTKEGVGEVQKYINGKTVVVVGQTGVGKSSLLNAIDPSYKREVGDYSESRGRGKHKTKEVILLPFNDGYLADTPGFSAFELELTKETLANFYPGLYGNSNKCYYSNCLHLSENKCHIKHMLQVEELPKVVYDEYVKVLLELPDKRRY